MESSNQTAVNASTLNFQIVISRSVFQESSKLEELFPFTDAFMGLSILQVFQLSSFSRWPHTFTSVWQHQQNCALQQKDALK
jgi:hypothetical protein